MKQSARHNRFALALICFLVVGLGVMSLVIGALAQSSGGSFQITSHVAASGADPGTGGGFSVTGTTSETAAGPLMGAPSITLQGGFWPTTLGITPLEPAILQFNSVSSTVTEGCAAAQITVTRTGGIDGAVTVDYSSSDGTARQRSDYEVAAGSLFFGPGETSKTIRVLVTEDAYAEGTETLTLNLTNPQGGSLGNPNTVTLQILDNDTVNPPTTQPIDDAGTFVCQHYHDFLARTADSGGFAFWVSQITQCGSNQTCINTKRLDVSNAFFYELEFQQTAAYVLRLYRGAYGNTQPFPVPSMSNPTEGNKIPTYAVFVADRARVIGGGNLAQKQLDLANLFVTRPEFLVRYPAGLTTADQFVDAVLLTLQNDLGVNLSGQRTNLINLYNTQGGRGAVMYRLADDNATTNPISNQPFIDTEYNRTFVLGQYFGYLRRNPDIAGFEFWLGQVNGAPLRDVPRQHAMVCSFITSAEYQNRFSSMVTHSNAECPQ